MTADVCVTVRKLGSRSATAYLLAPVFAMSRYLFAREVVTVCVAYMSNSSLSADRARHKLYAVMKTDRSFEEKAEQALSIGKQYLGVENGHVTKIGQESDYWRAIASTDGADGQFPTGLRLDLQETYCRRTAATDQPVALHDAQRQGWADDPAFETHGLHCYHGTTITVGEQAYGTVCFVSTEPREKPFSDDETMFAELIGRMLEHELQRERTATKIEHLDRFAGVVSHELRNPLNVAQGRVDIERGNRDSEHLAVAADALARMETLITDVLTMARQGHDIEATETVSLAAIAEECWQSVQTDSATLEIADDLRFKAAPDRSKRCFENLFRNAVEHGGDAVSVRAGPLENTDGFYIEDDGPGIPDPERAQVFETGYSTDDDGVGLGLAIVSDVVAAHGWSLSVGESTSGGARFEISDVVVV
ncbi:sensor histidine kinase [Haloarcula sediminis]|uniref:sensor histidine kinase n=1 Tax=Haloarcula sediminis TaxID=3111777 RepID=UPI002D787E8C|nr:ATP-binding protein [Haloarcula sp. CK38]